MGTLDSGSLLASTILPWTLSRSGRLPMFMRAYTFCCALALLPHVLAASQFREAFNDIQRHHVKDTKAFNRTIESLAHIAGKLETDPENPKYRKIRLLNKTFWERVGSVNGGISFMSALGFDLEQGVLQLAFSVLFNTIENWHHIALVYSHSVVLQCWHCNAFT